MNLANPSSAMRLLAACLLAILVVNLLYHGQQPYAVGLVRPPFDKVLHLVLFASVGTLLWIAAGARHILMVIVLAVMLGLLDEIMQSFNPGRSADWTDLLADTIGAGLGVLLCRRLAGQ